MNGEPMMTKKDAATVVRVLLRITEQIERAEYGDAIAMARLLGQLEFRIFGMEWGGGVLDP